jgi:type II secretory ATPase GspE/PulE/Tfp pilus assembly ATPase PilB-like protein
VSSLKIMPALNIAERRLPQDGRIEWKAGQESFDLRVSVLPTRHGEAVNLRILNRRSTFMRLTDLGFRPDQYEIIQDLAGQPYGMVLFTGPTGSGKTTSLYAALAHLNDAERKIITIEDPVEYQMAGITQLQVQPSIGFTFAAGLRSILRHDPDVVLIGEIRDGETAGIAVSAALTGHLVFSTLHTNDSAASLTRLVDMGIEPYLVASSVHGIVAQRLVRRLCPQCAEPEPLAGRMREELDALQPGGADSGRIRRGRGCPHCRFTGYSGRRPIFEIIEMNDELRAMVVDRASSAVLMRHAVSRGLVTLRRAAWDLVLKGETSVEELLRVTRRTRASDGTA